MYQYWRFQAYHIGFAWQVCHIRHSIRRKTMLTELHIVDNKTLFLVVGVGSKQILSNRFMATCYTFAISKPQFN